MVKQSGIYGEPKDSIPKPGVEGSNPFSHSILLGFVAILISAEISL
jgi:hypothetical protein